MAQPQHQASLPTPAPNSAFSPSPVNHQSPPIAHSQPPYAMPPNKRPRLSPAPASQPQSPYGSSYAASPGATGVSTPGQTPTSAVPSPQFNSLPLPTLPTATSVSSPTTIPTPTLPTPTAPHVPFTTPAMAAAAQNARSPHVHTNGQTTPLNLPDARPHTPATLAPQHPNHHTASPHPTPAQYTAATMAPIAPAPTLAAGSPATPGTMGPPSRPPDKPTKDDYDPSDMLAGTGIDLRAEEQLATELLFRQDRSYGIPQYPPGSKESFYGAGAMNQPPQHTDAQTQDELAAQSARLAWDKAAAKLAATKVQEMNDSYLAIPNIHQKLEKFTKDQGLLVHTELKAPSTTTTGRGRQTEDPGPPHINVMVKTLPDATVVTTAGSFVPYDSYLADQIALLSLACKQRMRTLLEDAHRMAKNRQESSHGQIPEEWADVAAPLRGMAAVEEEQAAAFEDASDAGTNNARKRSQSAANLEPVNGVPVKLRKIEKNETITSVRDLARRERDWEELRLRKRNVRKEGESSGPPSRAGSVAPGTPGEAGGSGGGKKDGAGGRKDGGKKDGGMSKKDQKKAAASKAAEASNHANQNTTSSKFMGGLGGVFGKKKYAWMTKDTTSGTTTPSRAGTPGPAGGGGGASAAAAEPARLTTDSRNRLGNWREDKDKGKGVQLRDWVAALEVDGVEGAVLQQAYDKLDMSGPK